MNAFTQLGLRIDREWGKHRYATNALPDIAATELERTPLHRIVDYTSILRWVGSSDGYTLPFQMNIDASFGEPPLTVFWHPDFYIETLFWANSTTSIHGHGFVGAFQVLAGTSVQSLFDFEPRDTEHDRCRIGRLRQKEAQLLRPGSTQRILECDQFIHSVFHLGYPSVTIVVRTHGRSVATQYDYHRPGVALRYRYESTFDQLTKRLLQVARLQTILKSGDLLSSVAKIGSRCDLAACFELLATVQPILYEQQRLGVAADVIGSLARAIGLRDVCELAEALTLEYTLRRLRRARTLVVEDDLRLFLALLLTQQERSFVLPLVTDYTGVSDAYDSVARWICDLGDREVLDVPSDEDSQRLLTTWLARGLDAALAEARTDCMTKDGIAKIQRIQAEALLTPLLRSPSAVT